MNKKISILRNYFCNKTFEWLPYKIQFIKGKAVISEADYFTDLPRQLKNYSGSPCTVEDTQEPLTGTNKQTYTTKNIDDEIQEIVFISSPFEVTISDHEEIIPLKEKKKRSRNARKDM